MSEDIGVRPDLGLTISIFGHMMEYFGNLGLKGQMTDEVMIDKAVLAETIGNMWLRRVQEFDKVAESVREAEDEYKSIIAEQLDEISALKESLAELQAGKKSTKKAKANEVTDESESK